MIERITLQMKLLQNRGNSVRNIHLLLLLAVGSVIFLLVPIDCISPGMGYFLAEKYLTVPCLLFFGSVLTQQQSAPARRNMLLSSIAVLWFAAAQLQHHLAQMGIGSFGVFAVVYLLAFPFASAAEQESRAAGIKWIGTIYVAASLLLVLCGVMLLLDQVPAALSPGFFMDSGRLNIMWHPNVLACIFMIGIGFTLYFLLQAETKWAKVALAALSVIQLCGMALTNSRTSILVTSGFLGGTVFFLIWKGGWKRFLAGAAAGLVVIVTVFSLSGALFDFHTQTQINRALQQAPIHSESAASEEETLPPQLQIDDDTGEIRLAGASQQHSLREDIWTLNNRTYIWKAAIQAVLDNPAIRLWGTEYVSMEISYRNIAPVGHAHNSWFQTMMSLGLPGLLIALAYTAIALFRCAVLLFHRSADLSKKVIVLLVLCIMAAGFLEPYLFVGDIFTLFANFIFFFLTGYLDAWCRELPGKKSKLL